MESINDRKAPHQWILIGTIVEDAQKRLGETPMLPNVPRGLRPKRVSVCHCLDYSPTLFSCQVIFSERSLYG
jgi:hypothetical protein